MEHGDDEKTVADLANMVESLGLSVVEVENDIALLQKWLKLKAEASEIKTLEAVVSKQQNEIIDLQHEHAQLSLQLRQKMSIAGAQQTNAEHRLKSSQKAERELPDILRQNPRLFGDLK